MSDIYSNPLAPQPQGPDEDRRNELLTLFQTYERDGYTAQQMVNSAMIQGFDRDLVNGEMYLKMRPSSKRLIQGLG